MSYDGTGPLYVVTSPTASSVATQPTVIDLVSPQDYANINSQAINDEVNGLQVPQSDLLPTDLDTVVPGSNLAAVYAMPYDPNYADEYANATGPSYSSPAYSATGSAARGANWKLWIALAVVALGLAIFRHKIGHTIDRLTG